MKVQSNKQSVKPEAHYSLGDLFKRRRRVQVSFEDTESMTEQSHKPSCDINNIMARYVATGTLDHARRYEGQYSDLTADDYHASMNKVAEAKSMFEELPSQVRRHFGNDVSAFLEFCTTAEDPAGQLGVIAEEYRKQTLGLTPDPAGQQEPEPSGMDAAPGEAPKGGEGSPTEGQETAPVS